MFRDPPRLEGSASHPIRRFARMWDPWDHLDGLSVGYSNLVEGGRYYPTLDLVVLGRRLSPIGEKCALAHELGHHHLAHVPTRDVLHAERQELRAKRWAAARMVEIEDLAEAMAGAPTWFEVADALEVDPELLEIRVAGLTDTERRQLLGMVGRRELGL